MPREVGSFFILITVCYTFCQTLVISLLDGNEIWFRPWWKKSKRNFKHEAILGYFLVETTNLVSRTYLLFIRVI